MQYLVEEFEMPENGCALRLNDNMFWQFCMFARMNMILLQKYIKVNANSKDSAVYHIVLEKGSIVTHSAIS